MPTLPRAAWLALGAILAAVLLPGGILGLPLPGPVAVIVAASLIVGAILAASRRHAAVAAMLLGAGTIAVRGTVATLVAASGITVPLAVGSGTWQAEVVDVSSPSGTEQRAFVRVLVPGRSADSWLVYAWLPRHPALLPGDRIETTGSLDAPPTDAPGFAGFLESRGAAGTLKAHTIELIGNGVGLGAGIEHLRWSVDDALSRAIPEPEAGLAAGILIGLRERVSHAVADDFTVTGLTHVVAISGWNIALVAGIATAMLRATGLRRRLRSAIVVIAIVAYTVLAGAEASVIRAAVMGGVVIIARESGRPSGAAAALAIACWGLLLVEPHMIEDIGLQLSLAATAGLLAMGARAESAVARLTAGRAPRWLCETLGVSLAAQLATLPLILLHFGRLSVISPLANLLVAPVVPLAMLGAAVGTLLGPLLVPPLHLLAAPVLVAAWLPLALMTRGAELLAKVPLATVELGPPLDAAGALVALLALTWALHRARQRGARPTSPAGREPATPGRRSSRRLPAVAVAVVLLGSFSIVLISRPLPSLQVSVLDIGQGDAILLQTGDGSRALIDGGPDPDLLVRRLDERIPLWDRRIDLVLLTHPHEDHSGGLAGLLPRYRIGRIAETGMGSQGAGVRELRAAASRAGVRRIRLIQGDQFDLGSAHIRVLWPPRESLPETAPSGGRAINDTSIVLSVSVGSQRLLLTGDLEEDRDYDLLEAMPRDGRRWDLLKVAHHGSATASSRPLLDVVRPRLAAISVGSDNRYGHPAPATLSRLDDVRARIWRTDLDGTLSVALDGRPRTAAALLSGPPSLPPCPAAPAGTRHARAGARIACYARPDGGTHPSRSALVAHVHVALASTPAAHDRGRRGRIVPGLSRDAGRCCHRPSHGRNSRAPPRRRQGLATRPSAALAGPWRSRGSLGQRGRAPRAGAHARSPSGHASHRERRRGLGQRCAPGRTTGRLRGQARHATRGLPGAALRALAAQASSLYQAPG